MHFISYAEAAEKYGCTTRHLRHLAYKGVIRRYRRPHLTPSVVLDAEELERVFSPVPL